MLFPDRRGCYVSPYEASEFASANLHPVHPNSILASSSIIIQKSFNKHSDIHSNILPFMNPHKQSTACVLRLSKLSGIQLVRTLFPSQQVSRRPTWGHGVELRPYFMYLERRPSAYRLAGCVGRCSSEWGMLE